MFKKLLVAVTALIASIGFAFAQVDVNTADQAALDSVKGIGPSISKKIVDERKKGGNFKDWSDFEKRVKGVGEKNAAKMSQAGLTVNGQALANAPAAAPAGASRTKMPEHKAASTPAAAASAPVAAKEPTAKDAKAKDAKPDDKPAATAAPVKK